MTLEQAIALLRKQYEKAKRSPCKPDIFEKTYELVGDEE